MMEAPAASRAVGGLQRLSSSSGVSSTSVSHGMSSVRSMSVASISSEGSSESHGVEQEEISALTHDVRAFKEALGYLRTIFQHSERDLQDNVRTMAHDRLGEVLRILRVVLEKHHTLQNTELLMAAGALIQQVKGHDYEDDKASTKELFDSIDKLALAFSSRVSEYLMGDLDVANLPFTSSAVSSKTKSYETLMGRAASARGRASGVDDCGPAAEQESELLKIEHSVEALLRRAKLCSKYLKDVVTYVEKRAHLDLEYSKNLAKLAQTIKPLISEESHLPLQGIFCNALDNDTDNCNAYQDTGSLILGTKFIEPMRARRLEHERRRKQLKDQWQRELRRMQEADGAKRKAYALFAQRQQAAKAAVDPDTKPERRRKVDDDAIQKAFEAESTYKKACMDVETQMRLLQKVKSEVLHSLQALLLQYDQTIKAASMNYFQLQHNHSSMTPVQFQRLYESSGHYEPGQQYHEFIKRFCALASKKHALQSSASLSQVMNSVADAENSFIPLEGPSGKILVRQAWGSFRTNQQAGSDSDSSHSTKSREPSPVLHSPPSAVAHLSGDELDQKTDEQENPDLVILPEDVSKASLSHKFRTINAVKSNLRCPECDNKIYLHALQCTECGLNCHKECTVKLTVPCGPAKVPDTSGIFGKDLCEHLQEVGCSIPPVVAKCAQEIDKNALTTKGIYRVSGVKSKVEQLVKDFESGLDKVDLTRVNCHVIASVLKLYLRQLPMPLLTYELYPHFIRLAKEWPSPGSSALGGAVAELEALVQRLPTEHLQVLRFLMHHLFHLAAHADANLMPPTNLGIVFGPTLLRTPNGNSSMACLMDTVHQTRAVELLITHAAALFAAVKHPADCDVQLVAAQQQQGAAELPGFIPEQAKDALSSPDYDPNSSQAAKKSKKKLKLFKTDMMKQKYMYDNILGFTSDDDLPDSFLPDYSNLDPHSPILRRHLKHSASAKIFKCSLKDYKGLEGQSPAPNKSSGAGETLEVQTPSHLRLRKSKSALAHNAGVVGGKGVRKDSVAESDVESHLSNSLESSSLRDEMERRLAHQQMMLSASGPASSIDESQSETEDGAACRLATSANTARNAKAPDAVDASRRAKSSTSGSSGGLIHSTKHHISVVTSHLVGRSKSAKRESLTISHPIPLAAAKKLGETVYHKIQILDDNQQPTDK